MLLGRSAASLPWMNEFLAPDLSLRPSTPLCHCVLAHHVPFMLATCQDAHFYSWSLWLWLFGSLQAVEINLRLGPMQAVHNLNGSLMQASTLVECEEMGASAARESALKSMLHMVGISHMSLNAFYPHPLLCL